MSVIGSYANGFAPRDGQPLYPELWRGCVGAWAPCLGPTGLTLRDWSKFGNHGTLTNMDAGSDWLPSRGRYSLDLDGSNDFIDYGVQPNIYGLSRFSFSGWIYKTSNSAGWMLNRYNTSAAGGTVGDFFGVTAGTSIPRLIAEFTGSSVSDFASFQTPDAITLNQWNHVCVSVDLANRASTIMSVNGVQRTVTITTGGTPPSAFKSQTSTAWTTARITNVSGVNLFSSLIVDDMMLSSVFLTHKQHRLLASRRGIAYELAPRRRGRVAAFKAYWAAKRAQIIGGGV